MTDVVGTHFGLVIAYVLPGFLTLWGLRYLFPEVQRWLSSAPSGFANLDIVLFVTLASVAAGLVVSAVRWVVIDSLHAVTGLRRPNWDDARLQQHLQAFEAIVQAHYRYYQFYANSAIALAFVYLAWQAQAVEPASLKQLLSFIVVEVLLLSTSRDNLTKYYARASRILSPTPTIERRNVMSNGHGPKPPPKPPVSTTKSSSKKK